MKKLLVEYTLSGQTFIDHTQNAGEVLEIEFENVLRTASFLGIYPLESGSPGTSLCGGVWDWVALASSGSTTAQPSLQLQHASYVTQANGIVQLVWDTSFFAARSNIFDVDVSSNGARASSANRRSAPAGSYSGFRIKRGDDAAINSGKIRIYTLMD